MDETNEDSMFIDPAILQKEVVISLPILSESDIEMMMNVEEQSSTASTSDDDEKEKPCLKRDQRRLSLLNNPNYGIILSFLEKFRSHINFKNYPLRIFEDNLISEHEKVSGRFMDFHLALLKKISPGKVVERGQFAANMTKFAYRFDPDDGEQLNEHGYSKVKIDTKLRILKNLLELQFDRNQSLKNAVADKPAFDISPKPFGRDRFGASYWLFADNDCFVRLFREDTDDSRTWVNLAKNSQELESVIKLLISDSSVRKKFPDWKLSKEFLNHISPSKKFEEEYGATRSYIKSKNEDHNSTSVVFGSTLIKTEHINLHPIVNLDRDTSVSPPAALLSISNIEVQNVLEETSDQDSINSEIINGNRMSILSSCSSSPSNGTKDESDSNDMSHEVIEKEKPKDGGNNDNGKKGGIYSSDASQESSEKEKPKDDDKNNNGKKGGIYSSDASQESSEKEQPKGDDKNNNGKKGGIYSSDGSQESSEEEKPKDDDKNNNGKKGGIYSSDASQESSEKEQPTDGGNNNNGKKGGIYSSDASQESSEKEKPKDDDKNNNGKKGGIYSSDGSQESSEKEQHQSPKNNDKHNQEVEVIATKPPLEQGIKRKLVDYDDTESEIGSEKAEEPSQQSQGTPANYQVPSNNADLPIALRRSRRGRRSLVTDFSADSSSTNKSASDSSRKKRITDRSWKNHSQALRNRSRRRGRKSKNEFSSSTSDERQPSEEDFSDESLPINTELDLLLNGDLLEEDDEDEDDDYIPHHRAKTVAECHEQFPIQSKPCIRCTQTDRPELLLLCEDCNDAYHLECLQPELFTIPNHDWYCPLCEHKRLCDGLIEKLAGLIKDEADFEMRRRLNVSKRRKRLTNVMVNLDRFVTEPPIKKQKTVKRVISSDEDDKASGKKTNSAVVVDDDDVDSVYGCKNDENRKPTDQEETEQTGKRRLRSCRRKAQNYSLDDYDKKMKAAMIDAGINKELIENDSDDSDNVSLKRKPSKKRARYELDEDFDASDGKNADRDFVPSRRRTITNGSRAIDEDSRTMTGNSRSVNDDSQSDGRDNDNYNDFGMSDDEIGQRNRRQSSASSLPKKKSNAKSARNNNYTQHKSLIISDEDTIPYDPNEPEAATPVVTVKSEPRTDFAHSGFPANVFGGTEIVKNVYDKNRIVENVVYTNEAANINKPRRPKRAPAKKKKPKIQDENVSDDEEEKSRPPPMRRLPAKKRRGSNDSSLDGVDDDYERLVHKRRLFQNGKAIVRTSITGHIKKLLGQEDDDDDDDEEEEEEEEEEADKEKEKEKEKETNGNEEEATKDNSSDGTKKDKNNNTTKKATKNSQHDELRLSDDDDFPDEQEILKTTGLLSLKKPAKAPKAAPYRAPFMSSMQSYQFAMVDPTAQFEFTCPADAPMTEPSDTDPANGGHTQATGT